MPPYDNPAFRFFMSSIRRLLTRCLLLTVLFYTVVGTPLHEVGHVKQWAAALAHDAAPSDNVGSASDDGQDGEAHHDLCLWCLSHAHQAVDANFTVPFPPPAPCAEVARPRPVDGLLVDNDHRPFAARDPPHALT